jgi:SNF2 family DNA or RNA helicase
VTATVLSVEGREIHVQPSFTDSMAIHKFGGRFSGSRWRWPATPANARMLRARLHDVRTTPEFDALLGPVARAVEQHFVETPAEVVVENAQALIAEAPTQETPAAETQQAELVLEEPPVEPETAVVESSAPVVAEAVPVAPPPVEMKFPLPEGLRTGPWRHQLLAYQFAMALFAAGYRGVLLAMWMGTGKSLVACMLLLAVKAKKLLIVCPLRVMPVWVSQFEKHVGIPVVMVTLDERAGTNAEKTRLAQDKLKLAQARGVPFVCVINYDSMWREPFATWAEKMLWDLIIADELHRAKSPSGRASTELKRLRPQSRYRLGLTGTPMPHGPMDVWAQFRFLDSRVFGPSFTAFRATYAEMGGYQRKQIVGFKKLEQLEASMSRITFRVGKEVLDLPEETFETYYFDMAGEEARVYDEMDRDFVARVKDGTIATAANALVKLLRLQQATGGFLRGDDDMTHRIGTGKLKLLIDTLEDIGPEEPVVVFAWFREDLDSIHEACLKLAPVGGRRERGTAASDDDEPEEEDAGGVATGYTSLELSGRRDELKQWQDDGAQVLAVQIQAGGVGVDLTRARYSIFYSTGFGLGNYEQAKARTHRPGQTKPVMHIHLVARDTVDVKVKRALENRADLVESILAEIRN